MFVMGLNFVSVCESFVGKFSFVNISIIVILIVVVGMLSVGGNVVFEYCLIIGIMNMWVSLVDGKIYVIGFEMCLFKVWNGWFYY